MAHNAFRSIPVERPEAVAPFGQTWPVGLRLDEQTGVISGIAQTAGGVFPGGSVATTTFWVQAQRADATGRIVAAQARPFVLVVTPTAGFDRTPPTWVSGTAPLGTFVEGQAMSLALSATDPSGPVSYRTIGPFTASGFTTASVAPGQQPVAGTIGGIAVTASGVISGTPEVSHNVTATVRVRATNARGLFRDQTVSFAVTNVRAPLRWVTPAGAIATARRGQGGLRFQNFTVPGERLARSTNQLEASTQGQPFGVRYRILNEQGLLPAGVSTIRRDLPDRRAFLEIAAQSTINGRVVPGTYSFTVRAEYNDNPGEGFADRTFSIVVTP